MAAGTRRVAGQHARARAKSLCWLRFFGGSFKRDYSSWSQGAEGEEVVGRVLDDLADEGWHVIHDVSFGRGNIDHIVVGPGGVFTIETKSRRGKVWIDRLDPKMVGQAYAEKKSLETVTGLEVQPILVFSQAYIVDRRPGMAPGRDDPAGADAAWIPDPSPVGALSRASCRDPCPSRICRRAGVR